MYKIRPSIRQFLLLILALGAISTSINAQKSTQSIIEAEAARFKAMIGRDTVALRSMLHPDLVYIHSNALRESRDDFYHSVASGRIRYESITHEVATPTRYKRIGMVEGIVKVTGRFNDTPFETRLRYTSVYRRTKGHWVLYRWQSTRLNN
jgi:ketosteroid isomerase-like protein